MSQTLPGKWPLERPALASGITGCISQESPAQFSHPRLCWGCKTQFHPRFTLIFSPLEGHCVWFCGCWYKDHTKKFGLAKELEKYSKKPDCLSMQKCATSSQASPVNDFSLGRTCKAESFGLPSQIIWNWLWIGAYLALKSLFCRTPLSWGRRIDDD